MKYWDEDKTTDQFINFTWIWLSFPAVIFESAQAASCEKVQARNLGVIILLKTELC